MQSLDENHPICEYIPEFFSDSYMKYILDEISHDDRTQFLNDLCIKYYIGEISYQGLEKAIRRECRKTQIYADITLRHEVDKIVDIYFTRVQNSFDLSQVDDLLEILRIFKTREFFYGQTHLTYTVGR